MSESISLDESIKVLGINAKAGYYKDVERAIRDIKGYIDDNDLYALFLTNMVPGTLEFLIFIGEDKDSQYLKTYVQHWVNILEDEKPFDEVLTVTWENAAVLGNRNHVPVDGWQVPDSLQFLTLLLGVESMELEPAMAAVNPELSKKKHEITINDGIKSKFRANLIKNFTKI